MNTEAWKVDDEAWVRERQRAWEAEGMPLVVGMYQRGGDLNAEKAEAVKEYFLTGRVDEPRSFPLFYLLRFYPGEDEAWLESQLRSADDFSLARFFKMYGVDSLGKHNRRMAELIYSPWMTARLASMDESSGKELGVEVLSRRDYDLTKAWCLHILRSVNDDYEAPDHYWFHAGDRWLSIAQNFKGRSNRNDHEFVRLLEAVMSSVAQSFAEGGGGHSGRDRFVLGLKELLDEGVSDSLGLREAWNREKASRGIS